MTPNCPVCCFAVTSSRWVLQGPPTVSVFECPSCCMEFIAPFLNSEFSDFSTVTHSSYIEAMRSEYSNLRPLIDDRVKKRLAFYASILGRSPQRIIEVGCGPGWMVHGFQSLGIPATGLEIDPSLTNAALPGSDVRLGDICILDPSSLGRADVVTSSQTLEHILTPRTALRQMNELLPVGGILHIDVPNADSWGARYRRVRPSQTRFGAIDLPHHQVGYRPQALAQLLEDAGFEIETLIEAPTDHPVFGQTILPKRFLSRMFVKASRLLGHGYLLIAVARKKA